MQPSGFGYNGNLVIGVVVGGGFVLGMLFGMVHLRNRRRAARRERPPQKENLLRPAGYSAMCRIEDLSNRFVLGIAFAAIGGVACGGTAGVLYPVFEGLVFHKFTIAQLLRVPKVELMLSAVCFLIASLLWTIREMFIVWKNLNEMANWRLGMRGERAVAECLADRSLAAAGYVTFHDVPADDGKWNIDHVVVGPAGVFVLETKARTRRKAKWEQDENVVKFDGRRLQFPWCYDDAAVEQVGRNVEWMRDFLAGFPPKDIRIQPVIVVPGWFVDRGIPLRGVRLGLRRSLERSISCRHSC